MKIPSDLNVAERIDFDSEWEGSWQRLPDKVLRRLSQDGVRVGIKFGMGLLKVPQELDCKILSYHHGDPRKYRGRPAGFYELLAGESSVGQIVQIISNRLDAGAVVAFAETRVQGHSYRATMTEAYAASPLLLGRALANSLSDVTLPIAGEGKNFRLPSNSKVIVFASKLLLRKAKRLIYGAFYYKDWDVAAVQICADDAAVPECVADRTRWQVLPRPKEYHFLADPFPHPRDGVLVEALRRSDGQGEIVHFTDETQRVLCTDTGHFSYPATVEIEGEWFLLPEVSEWTSPRIYRLSGDTCELVGKLRIAGMPRLADATLFAHRAGLFLFGNRVEEGAGILRLWTAPTLFSDFSEHPDSPIRISPSGSRMAGAIASRDGQFYRFGQNFSGAYGDGIVVFQIEALSSASYREAPIADLRFEHVRGPHTLNFHGDRAYFDFYNERFTPMAGVRRLRSVISKHAALSETRPLQA